MPRTTNGGVDHPAGWHRGEELHDPLEEHRLVPELPCRTAGVAHLQPPGELVPAGISPRNGLDGKRAEKGPSIALPGGLQGSDTAPRISVVVSLLSPRWWVVASVTGATSAGKTELADLLAHCCVAAGGGQTMEVRWRESQWRKTYSVASRSRCAS